MNNGQNSRTGRLWEVDFLRGLAIIMMVIFHLAYDLDFFRIYEIDLSGGFWFYLARFTASLFLLLVGISLTLSHSRAKLAGQRNQYPFRLLKRSLWIMSLAMGITLVTYIVIGRGFIVFGILHLISISILLAYPLLRLGRMNILLGLAAILLGLYIQELDVDFFWLIWLGLAPRDFVWPEAHCSTRTSSAAFPCPISVPGLRSEGSHFWAATLWPYIFSISLCCLA